MFTYEQLLEAGFSESIAHNILNTEMHHSYSQQELHDVRYSDNPLESYNRMMEEKAQAAINHADALEARIGRDFGVFAIV